MKKKRYPREFREEAVKAVVEGERTLKEVSASLGISYWTLREWKKEYMDREAKEEKGKEKRSKLSVEEELEQLRKENAELKMDNTILKKFAAMLSREL